MRVVRLGTNAVLDEAIAMYRTSGYYEIKNKLFAWLDRRLRFVDGFVTAELRSIRAHFEGIAASYNGGEDNVARWVRRARRLRYRHRRG